jgi:hypothetical protein
MVAISALRPAWKCRHGIYLGGSPDHRALYCTLCRESDEPFAGDGKVELGRHRTCQRCCQTKSVDQFPETGITGTCLECSPRPRAIDSPERRRERSLIRRDRSGNLTLDAWYQKIEAAGRLCTFCECPLTPATAICVRWIPLKQGGKNDLENCTPSCQRCARIRAASVRWQEAA